MAILKELLLNIFLKSTKIEFFQSDGKSSHLLQMAKYYFFQKEWLFMFIGRRFCESDYSRLRHMLTSKLERFKPNSTTSMILECKIFSWLQKEHKQLRLFWKIVRLETVPLAGS